MKNGDPRSPAWIARRLKTWKRDDETVETWMLIVGLDRTPSLAEIAEWSDEQCLLAEDWALATHLRASDNLVRVPAVPAHLQTFLTAAATT